MKSNLPDFDELLFLANNKPDDLERLRKQLIEEAIQDAPPEYQRRLRGIQFQVDMKIRQSSNPMSACVAISKLMYESLHQLQLSLTDPEHAQLTRKRLNGELPAEDGTAPADVICLTSRRTAAPSI
ncbi:DUF3135 domain-containing protein [Endozoicomonas sp. SM1973]|uniref:DUF3135 domain-containing protein n=1 Tax=Spartinivicinus marinus TaxID=2994442 RepID=A0A853I512_9GAMM|nr:DUF3135 domain-containing protein [Spartinivicinus marinus]MCX4025537.1 DUF3135 domain-containing protein [Spartinivicinus marinus]NYZ65234.1 DUF3135 domain-containing protein [Spartinivicinus marinus]